MKAKIVSEYDQEYHNHKLQANPWHREEEPHNKVTLQGIYGASMNAFQQVVVKIWTSREL